MIEPITISQFMTADDRLPLIDVRTPAEFNHGHVPGALNLPLFTNEERVVVGTTYKQQGKEPAILLGFDLAGPKWSGFIREAVKLAPAKRLMVHCWRGGMRSGAMAWALNLYGFEVKVINGGYKSFRRWCKQQFERSYQLMLIGGMTGSGKTKMLHELRRMGEQVIDLEQLACHQGSVYGSMDRMMQPSQEQFENNLAVQLAPLKTNRRIWVEDESINIGQCQVPSSFWKQMQKAGLLELQVLREVRLANLLTEYGSLDKKFLIEKTERIRKRLGPEQTRDAIAAIEDNRMADFINIALVYYDKTYRKGLLARPVQQIIPVHDISADNLIASATQSIHL